MSRSSKKKSDTSNSTKLPYNYPDQSESRLYLPDWGKYANQDYPFKDGLSGHLDIEITAKTAICVGGEQTEKKNDYNETQFYQLPDNTYAIPWSSLKGMIRSLMKAATFGRADQVDNQYSGIRRRPGGGESDYNTLREKVKEGKGYGVMFKNKQGEPTLIEYSNIKAISYQIFADKLGKSQQWWREKSIKEKYECIAEAEEEEEGKLAFGTHNGKRANEWLFINRQETAQPISKELFKKFEDTYSKKDKSLTDPAFQCPWQFYWKKQYEEKGEEVPVYLFKEAGKIQHISMTQLPKFASLHSTHDMLNKVDTAHLEQVDFIEKLPDLAECIFGLISDSTTGDNSHSLKGRVDGTPFRYTGKNITTPTSPIRLLQPEPGHPSIRIEQPHVDEKTNTVPTNRKFYTPLSEKEYKNPRLRLFNRYYARGDIFELDSSVDTNPKLDRKLHTLPEGTVFTGQIRFHNLKQAELGALLWILEWGSDKHCWHNLGGGKPYGYGAINIQATVNSNYRLNDRNAEKATSAEIKTKSLTTFKKTMNSFIDENWENHPRITSLKSMANPEKHTTNKPGDTSRFPYPEPKIYNDMENNRKVLPKPEA